MRIKTATLFTLIASLAAFQAGLFAQTTLESPLATVKLIRTDIVSISTYKAEVAVYEKMLGRKLTLEEKKEKLKQNINILLLLQACDRDGISVSDAEVNKTIQMLSAQQNNGVPFTDAQLEDWCRKQGLTVAEYKQTIKKQLMVDRFIMSKKQKEIEALRYVADPTESEIMAFYTKEKASFKRPEYAMVSIMLVPYKDKTDAEKASARDYMRNLSVKIGTDANSFAIYISEGKKETSVYKVADGVQIPLGDKSYSTLFGDAFMNGVFRMSVGGIAFIESDKGVFIVRMSDRIAAKDLSLADPVSTGVTLRDYIIQLLKKNRIEQEYYRIQTAVIEELRMQAAIATNEALLNY